VRNQYATKFRMQHTGRGAFADGISKAYRIVKIAKHPMSSIKLLGENVKKLGDAAYHL
jgi:hypothetical protein